MPPTGRPRILNDFKRGQIAAIIGAGGGIAAAARCVGCSVDTIRREAVRNEDFRQQLQEAEGQALYDPLRAMRDAAATHWRAAAWLLERTNPQQFDRRRPGEAKRQEIEETINAVIRAAVEEIADPRERERVCRRLIVGAARSGRQPAPHQPSASDFAKRNAASSPTSDVDQLLAELERDKELTLAHLGLDRQNSRRSA